MNKDSDIDIDKSGKITREQEIIEKLSIAAPIGIGVVVDRIFTFANSFLCKMLEYSRDELIGNSSSIIYPTEEDYDFVGKEKYDQLNKYGFGTVETRFRTKTGRVLNVILSSTRVDKNDFSKGTIFTVLDITERKIMEEKNKQLNENLKILNKILRHDIANNLTVVSIVLEMIDTKDQDLKNKAFNAIKRSVDLIEKIKNLDLNPDIFDVFGGVFDLSWKSKAGFMDRKIMSIAAKGLEKEKGLTIDKRGKNDFRDWDQIKLFALKFADMVTSK